ncbi:MAG: hypothetical protein HQM02_07585 [Magnetococcales bacterium]|nr:hypothetical protein [Magnetococcales bacterium]
MSALSQVSSIVVERAQQAESRIREGINQNVRMVQETVRSAQATSNAVRHRYAADAFKVDLSKASLQKAAAHG